MKNIVNAKELPMLLKCGILLMTFKCILSNTRMFEYTGTMDNVLVFFAVGFLVASLVQSQINLKQAVVYVGIEAACAYVSIKVDNFSLMITFLTCFAIIGRNFNEVIKFVFKVMLMLYICHVIWFLYQMAQGGSHLYVTRDGEKRYRLGFSHPNLASVIFFNLVIMWIWLHYGEVSKKNVVYIILLTAAVYLMTRTRTMLIEVGCALVLYGIAQINRRLTSPVVIWTARIIMPLLFVLICLCVVNYNKNIELVLKIDQALSSRIKLGAYGLQKWGISWFGQPVDLSDIKWDRTWKLNSTTFDCVYSYFFVNFGIFWAICLYALFFVITKKRNTKYNVFIILWALYGITEVHGLNGYMCFPILLLSQIFENTEWLKRRNAKVIKEFRTQEMITGVSFDE